MWYVGEKKHWTWTLNTRRKKGSFICISYFSRKIKLEEIIDVLKTFPHTQIKNQKLKKAYDPYSIVVIFFGLFSVMIAFYLITFPGKCLSKKINRKFSSHKTCVISFLQLKISNNKYLCLQHVLAFSRIFSNMNFLWFCFVFYFF